MRKGLYEAYWQSMAYRCLRYASIVRDIDNRDVCIVEFAIVRVIGGKA